MGVLKRVGLGIVSLSLPACPQDHAQPETTDVDPGLATSETTDAGSAGSSDATTETPALETSTDAIDSSSGSPGSSSGSESTTGDAAGECGDGSLDPGEECDLGAENDNEGACTAACHLPVCGDGYTWAAGGEECDNGDDNEDDAYGKCATDCAWGPRCGDDTVQHEHGEMCDGADDGNDNNGEDYEGAPCSPTCRYDAKLVFVTSASFQGDFGSTPEQEDGVEEADAICHELGQLIVSGLETPDGKPLTAEFRAWLSSDTKPASSRFITHDKQYALRNGVVVANNWADFSDGSLAVPISVDEHGDEVGEASVWTNTTPTGELVSAAQDCVNWTSASIGISGRVGSTKFGYHVDTQWTQLAIDNGGEAYCFWSKRLYCVEQ